MANSQERRYLDCPSFPVRTIGRNQLASLFGTSYLAAQETNDVMTRKLYSTDTAAVVRHALNVSTLDNVFRPPSAVSSTLKFFWHTAAYQCDLLTLASNTLVLNTRDV